ncbi:MAG: T9SS type A sorting domain-containing protein [Saprospiraceae bacterium]|nr:T9SS type A sorting domain-containing protein [Saprospiraceae bacterium]
MAHLWSGGPADAFLGMDPASGINAQGTLVSTKYNDFANLRWLGFKHGNIPMFSSERAAEWHCVEGHIKLNTPGSNNGLMEFWINDTLQAGSYQMNWHGNWNSNPNNYGINAIFFENYWNAGSPVQQERYFDNLVIATQRIGCNQLTSSTSKPDQDPIKIWFDQNGMLNWDAESNQIYRLKIMSPQGQIISVIDIQNSGRTEIENQLPAGIYFYQLNRGADILSSGKLNIY